MKAYRGEEVKRHSFLRSALDEGEWSTSRPNRLTPGKKFGSQMNRGMDGSQGTSRRSGKAINLLPLTGIDPGSSSPYPTH